MTLDADIRTVVEGQERFRISEIAAAVGTQNSAEFRLALHRVFETLRAETGAVYTPVKGSPGTYNIASGKQRKNRARRFISAAGRKVVRADEIAQTISENDVHPEERAALARMKEKTASLASREQSSFSLRGQDPPAPKLVKTRK